MRDNILALFVTGLPILSVISIVITFKLWLFGSLGVSGVKAMSGKCGTRYPIEVFVINGDWFCESKKVE